jgi:hypothetical protein
VKFVWDSKVARQIAQFGGWMILSSGTYFLASRGERPHVAGLDTRRAVWVLRLRLHARRHTCVGHRAAGEPGLPPHSGGDDSREPSDGAEGTSLEASGCSRPSRFASPGRHDPWAAARPTPRTLRSFVGLGWMVQLLGLRAALEIYCSPTSMALLRQARPAIRRRRT